jgi:hypothetical protein
VLHLAHLPPQAAHPGTRCMWENISREFYWPTLKRDCEEYVAQCLSCAAVKAPINRRTRPLQLFPPDGPWEVLCADILGPFPVTLDGQKYLLVLAIVSRSLRSQLQCVRRQQAMSSRLSCNFGSRFLGYH